MESEGDRIDRKAKPRLYSSPSSDARIKTPIKSALYNSNKQAQRFIKKVKELIEFDKSKENAGE